MGPTKAGWRTAPMPAELATALEIHREVQLLQRKDWAPYKDQNGKEHDLIFCHQTANHCTHIQTGLAGKTSSNWPRFPTVACTTAATQLPPPC